MKKRLSVVFVVLAIMAMLTSTVSAAPAQAGKSVELVSVEYQKGGIVLLFETSGLTESDLKNATFYANSNFQSMYCNFIDDTTDVRCVVAKSLAGVSFSVNLGGFAFSDSLPGNNSCPEGEIAFLSYDVYYHGELVYSGGVVPLDIWNDAVTSGFFDEEANYSWNYNATGRFCSPDYWGPI